MCVLDARGDLVWSRYQFFFFDMPILVLPPSESVQHDYTWDLTDYAGNAVAPGEYELVGVIYGDRSVSTRITLVPEPGTLVLLLPAIVTLVRRRHLRERRPNTAALDSPFRGWPRTRLQHLRRFQGRAWQRKQRTYDNLALPY